MEWRADPEHHSIQELKPVIVRKSHGKYHLEGNQNRNWFLKGITVGELGTVALWTQSRHTSHLYVISLLGHHRVSCKSQSKILSHLRQGR